MRRSSGTILEVSEPPSPEEQEDGERTGEEEGPSALANLLKRSSPPSSLLGQANIPQARFGNVDADQAQSSPIDETPHPPEAAATEDSEYTPLLGRRASGSGSGDSTSVDFEGQKTLARTRWLRGLVERRQKAEHHVIRIAKIASSPRSWNGKAIWETAVVDPVSCLPAVAVGLLLNILDALSYGESIMHDHKRNAADQTRYDSVSTWNASFLPLGICWYFYILCQHNCGATRLLYGQYIQRGGGI